MVTHLRVGQPVLVVARPYQAPGLRRAAHPRQRQHGQLVAQWGAARRQPPVAVRRRQRRRRRLCRRLGRRVVVQQEQLVGGGHVAQQRVAAVQQRAQLRGAGERGREADGRSGRGVDRRNGDEQTDGLTISSTTCIGTGGYMRMLLHNASNPPGSIQPICPHATYATVPAACVRTLQLPSPCLPAPVPVPPPRRCPAALTLHILLYYTLCSSPTPFAH